MRNNLMFKEVDEFFKDFFNGFSLVENKVTFPLNAYQTGEFVEILLYVPNLNSKDVNITISDNVLKIEGKILKDENADKKQYYRREFIPADFVRTVVLPAEVKEDKADASYEKGILKITLPKKDEVKETKIKVKEIK